MTVGPFDKFQKKLNNILMAKVKLNEKKIF